MAEIAMLAERLTELSAGQRLLLRFATQDAWESGCFGLLSSCRKRFGEQGCAWVSLDGALISNLRVWENILLTSGMQRPYSPKDVYGPVCALLERSGMVAQSEQSRWLAETVNRVSGKDRLRIALIRAIMQSPRLAFMEMPVWSAIDDVKELQSLRAQLAESCALVLLSVVATPVPPSLSPCEEVDLELCGA